MTVTFVDGLVVARSTYNTDINYRSVVIIGDATEVKDLEEKRVGLEALVEHIIPGRTADARPPTEKELRSTMLLKLPLTESSAKVRTGWPSDEDEDYDLSIWAGVIPFATRRSRSPWSTRPCGSSWLLPTTWTATSGPSRTGLTCPRLELDGAGTTPVRTLTERNSGVRPCAV